MSRLSKVAVILGSGRSMTSGVAKGMHMAGFSMGHDLLPPSPSNPHGHFEDRHLVALNDRILASMDAAWDRPPPVGDPAWYDARADWSLTARAYLQDRFEDNGQFGMKDPRVTVTWPVWSLAFELMQQVIDPILIGVQRDPAHAAASLTARDGTPPDDAADIVDAYQVRVHRILDGTWFPRRATT